MRLVDDRDRKALGTLAVLVVLAAGVTLLAAGLLGLSVRLFALAAWGG